MQILDQNKILVLFVTCGIMHSNLLSANISTQGVLGDIQSWETSEYKSYWGLEKINASIAYAIGANGSGVKLGIVDSGMFLSHPEFLGDRISAISTNGNYFFDGMRYPDAEVGNTDVLKDRQNKAKFQKDEKFSTTGNWIKGINDSHGTHVGGTIAANRDGKGMHGVAWGANLVSANTGGSDGMTYGPTQDYGYFSTVYQSLASSGVRAINNSWGANRKVNSSFSGALGFTQGESIPAKPSDYLYIKDLDNAKKAYYQFMVAGHKTWLDAAYEVAANNKIIQVFTAGNRDKMQESYTRAMLPYFRPSIENLWINVTGSTGSDSQRFNMPGHSKWWSIAAPSEKINSTTVSEDGKDGYDQWDGTSMAAPHVTGALGVIMSRYTYMSNEQIRDVMLTTARQIEDSFRTRSDGRKILIPEFKELGVPNEKWGWGIVDIGKAMFGPGQFLGKFHIVMNSNDIWSNDISDVALKARKAEDEKDKQEWKIKKEELDLKRKNGNLSKEESIEYDIQTAREMARNEREEIDYQGYLIKSGKGTLTLTGTNTYTGDTIINGGKIIALNQSLSSSNVIVNNGGSLQIEKELMTKTVTTKSKYNQAYVFKDIKTKSMPQKINAIINQGGRFVLSKTDSENVNVKFENGSIIGISPEFDELILLRKDATKTKNYSTSGEFKGYDNALVDDYALFSLIKNFSNNKLSIELKKGIDIVDLAGSKNENIIASVIQNSENFKYTSISNTVFRAASATNTIQTSDLYRNFLFATTQEAKDTLKTLANESNFAAQNSSIINTILLENSILKDSDLNRIVKQENGVSFWTDTFANKISYKNISAKSKSYSQIFGADSNINENIKIGALIGLEKMDTSMQGKDEYKNHSSKFGFYTKSNFSNLLINAGVIYANTDRKKQPTSIIINHISSQRVKSKEKTLLTYANAGYDFAQNNISLRPHVGISYINSKIDGMNEKVGPYNIGIYKDSRDLGFATIGLNTQAQIKKLVVNANFLYGHFFSQKSPALRINLADAGFADLKGEELRDIGSIDLGLGFTVFKDATVNLSYVGVLGDNIKSNGLNIQFKLFF
ncbi:S8 family serine peptidase [Campylobacter sp. 9BO]|uniref:S8 family serine peptidase n=1 Tax=Campylobacter sp. 9BO TaxID=3424759 RepID=UPI003D3544CA